MALTIYKISEYVNWRATGNATFMGGGGGGTVDLSNYYTITQLNTEGASTVNFMNISNAYHNWMLGLEGGLEPDSDESSGGAGEYYHLSYADYLWVLSRPSGGSLWVEESEGILYPVDSGITGIDINGLSLGISNLIAEFCLNPDIVIGGSGQNLTVKGGDAIATGGFPAPNGGNLYLRGGLGDGTGEDGGLFFSDGAFGVLPLAPSDVTNVVHYDPAGGRLYYGDGGGIGGGVSLSGSTNNTVCTVTGADAIQGEANLTYDGTDLTNSAGDMYADNFVLNSDRRLKTKIEDYNSDELLINYKQFELKSDPDQLRFGVVAQEIKKLYPELVRENCNGHLAVSYIDLLVREVANLKKRVKELESK